MNRLSGRSNRRHFIHNSQAVAAIEFALLLPLMLTLFFGSFTLSRGYYALKKVDLVAHNLADLTARTVECNGDATSACLRAADVEDIFRAGAILMSPLPTDSLKMTISEIGVLDGGDAHRLETSWSMTRNGEVRACGIPPVMPGGFAAASAPLGAIIVVDVAYAFSPGFNYETFAWNKPLTWNFKRSHYAIARNLVPAAPGTNLPDGHINNLSGEGAICK